MYATITAKRGVLLPASLHELKAVPKTQQSEPMPAFSYSVTTKLPRGRVWSLLTDITNWPRFSDMYSDLRWEGTPWAEGSAIVGQLNFPIVVSGRYVIRECNPPALIRYLSQTEDAGFATERTITLEQLVQGTLIRAEAFLVGEPQMQGGGSEFLKRLTTRWFDEFARFCDNQNNLLL
jgi:uncharacterized protein YndB with AHSA1/START domain